MVVRNLSRRELSSLIGGSTDCLILWFSYFGSEESAVMVGDTFGIILLLHKRKKVGYHRSAHG